jgi:DNA-binding MarR family transcriptional regulator
MIALENLNIFFLLSCINRHRERRFTSIMKRHNISALQQEILLIVSNIQNCSMTRLNEILLIDRTTLTRVVDKLVASDLIARTTAAHDRRLVCLNLTRRGAEAHHDILVDLQGCAMTLLNGSAAGDVEAAAQLLESILDRLIGGRVKLDQLAYLGAATRLPGHVQDATLET